MPASAKNPREDLIRAIIKRAKKLVPESQAKNIRSFIRQYYGAVALDDLKSRSIEDITGSLISHWKFISKRQPGEAKVKIFNPTLSKDGWQSTHTIILVAHDDMPFIVDSLRMELNRHELYIHLVLHTGNMQFCRTAKGNVTDVLSYGASNDVCMKEAPILIEIDRQTDSVFLKELENNLLRVLHDVRVAVEDWQPMRSRIRDVLEELESVKKFLDPEELAETKDFLRWIESDHFTFLGCRDYKLQTQKGDKALAIVPGTGLGVLREEGKTKASRTLSSMTAEARRLALSSQILIISKTNTKSSVHRPVYTDYIGVKRFNKKGQVIGERRIIGLYTSAAYNTNPKHIPFLRRKVAQVLKSSQLAPAGHAGKALLNILETLPRDDLFQTSAEELKDLSMGILHLQERQMIRIFARRDIYGRFMSCLVYVPRDRFNTELRQQMQDALSEEFQATESSFFTYFSDSHLARIHFIHRIDSHNPPQYDIDKIEKRLIEIGRLWRDELKELLIDRYGEENGIKLANRYCPTFSAGYRESYVPRVAVMDIERIESLSEYNTLEIAFYRPVNAITGTLRLKLFRLDATIPLSDVLPILENMGLRVISENPHHMVFKNNTMAWVNDFGMAHADDEKLDIEKVRDTFQQAFRLVWNGEVENDGFNRLVLSAELNAKEVTVFRAYAQYLRQTGFTHSQSYIASTLAEYPKIAKILIALFHCLFDPALQSAVPDKRDSLEKTFYKALEKVVNLDKDRIFRRYFDLMMTTLRCNYYQQDEFGFKPYFAFKFDSGKVPELPLPRPLFEIFVYSPRFEGIHLRGAKVARGGLRWSDRREDFRTEVLGLMKAQKVKNTVIVPGGAKGGFVPKLLPVEGGREAVMDEVINCYKQFISGLLDLTDNLIGDKIISPKHVVRYDADDPYLVVAADKGTATFSDIANDIATSRGFWLGDAFASGGSVGYDHKKMGITAKGAWESVKRHFRELSINTQTTPFTVVGIGDMGGDVFGNGMLLSKHIKLVAAFNHMHIFIDPDPDTAISFKERQRLFNLPRSSWTDYNVELISRGGGIFERSAKSIKLTSQIKRLLDLKQDIIVPNELIRAILKSEVDLIWNGGIGTYVKASSETHDDVGDHTNDCLRVNGNELRARVVAEGGNLGLTQLGRVEFALNDGIINTDFIDNSAGVDCSDHEVNIKILLNGLVAAGTLSIKQRNKLLADMTDEVSDLVLKNNYWQTQALSFARSNAVHYLELHARYIASLENQGKLDRSLEFLPDEKALIERKAMGIGLMRPGFAVLLAYTKAILKDDILASEVPEDPAMLPFLESAFPQPLRRRYASQMQSHRLKREIIATQLSNAIVNEMGITFIYRLHDETGAPVSAIVKAYAIARNIFSLPEIWRAIEDLDNQISAELQLSMMVEISRMVRRAARWFLRNRRTQLDILSTTEDFSPPIRLLRRHLPQVLLGDDLLQMQGLLDKYEAQNVPHELAYRVASVRHLFSALDIIQAATQANVKVLEMTKVYYALGERLDLAWFKEQVTALPIDNHWEALAREALRDDIEWQQRSLAISVFQTNARSKDPQIRINHWLDKHQALFKRWQYMLAELRSTKSASHIMYSVAIRELLDLTQTSSQSAKEELKKNKVQRTDKKVVKVAPKKVLAQRAATRRKK